MAKRIIYVWTGGRSGLVVSVLGIIAIVAVFVIAIATGVSLLAALFFGMLIVGCAEQFCRRSSADLSVREARQELNRIEREGQP